MSYDIEKYWDIAALGIETSSKKDEMLKTGIVGPTNPFYVYGKQRILEELRKINVKDKKVLEVGCGIGGNAIFLKKRGADIIGIDISSAMIDLARENAKKHDLKIPLYKTDGKSLNLESDSFDIILTVAVFQHIIDESDLDKLVSEIARVVKKRGEIVIMEGTSDKKSNLSAKKRSQYSGHVKLRSREYYIELFKKYGCTIQSYHVINTLIVDFINRMFASVATLKNKFYADETNKERNKKEKIKQIYTKKPNRIEYLIMNLGVMISKITDKVYQCRGGVGIYYFMKKDR